MAQRPAWKQSPSCCKSSRFKAQLYFCAMPLTVNRSFSSRRRVGAMFTTSKGQQEHSLVPALQIVQEQLFASLLNTSQGRAASMSMSYPARAAFFCSSTFILPMSEIFPLMVLMALS